MAGAETASFGLESRWFDAPAPAIAQVRAGLAWEKPYGSVV